MTPRAKGWGGTVPRPIRSHMGRPISAVARSLALVVALLLLGGCEGIFGGILTSGVTYLGDAVGDDMRTTAAWRAKHQEIVSQVLTGILTQCRALEGADIDKSVACYRKALEFSEEQQPRILLERLADRARRAKARREAVVPEPKMLTPE